MDGTERYFVLWPDGRKFGPADVTTLAQWFREGRITPETLLEPESGGPPVPASSIALESVPPPVAEPAPVPVAPAEQPFNIANPDLEHTPFEIPDEYPLTTGSPYPVESYYAKGKSAISNAWGLIIGGFIATFLIPCCWYLMLPGALGMTGAGIYYARKAKREGDSSAHAPFIAGIVVLCLQVLGLIGLAVALTSFFWRP